MTRVELVRESTMALCAGQRAGAFASGPGVLESPVIKSAPADTPHNQTANAPDHTLRPPTPVLLSSLNSDIRIFGIPAPPGKIEVGLQTKAQTGPVSSETRDCETKTQGPGIVKHSPCH